MFAFYRKLFKDEADTGRTTPPPNDHSFYGIYESKEVSASLLQLNDENLARSFDVCMAPLIRGRALDVTVARRAANAKRLQSHY